ncbi:MAG: DUF3365 domain-containing protein [Thermodesulfobacteriota bacterium]
MKRRVGAIIILLLLPALGLAAVTPYSGAYYLVALEESMAETITTSQELINRRADGAPKDASLEPEALLEETGKMFFRIMGEGFQVESLQEESDPAKIAPVLAAMLQAGRLTIATAQEAIDTEADGTVKRKRFNPATFGRLTLARFKAKTGVTLKQTTLGTKNYGARHSYNRPEPWERASLEKFSQAGWSVNQGIGEQVGGEYRFIKPIYIKKDCLICHGGPMGEMGPYGYPKEGYGVGDIRGGISVTIPTR